MISSWSNPPANMAKYLTFRMHCWSSELPSNVKDAAYCGVPPSSRLSCTISLVAIGQAHLTAETRMAPRCGPVRPPVPLDVPSPDLCHSPPATGGWSVTIFCRPGWWVAEAVRLDAHRHRGWLPYPLAASSPG